MLHLPIVPAALRLRRLFIALTFGFAVSLSASSVPDDFPRFDVPGFEKEMASLRSLFWLHYEPAGPLIPLWDEWMPMSTLWPAREGDEASGMRARWATALGRRMMNAEGYIHTEQHDGPAHAEGWPFPKWNDSGGVGWHFRGTGIPGYEAPLATPEGWNLKGAEKGEIHEKGWAVRLAEPKATLQPPGFSINARQSPWLRINWWATGLEGANCFVEWTTKEQPEFSRDRRAYFPPATRSGQTNSFLPMGAQQPVELTVAETRTMIPLYRVPGWTGTITGLRLSFENRGPASLVIKSLHTACDTRHTINNPNFVRGCKDYFMWSRDIAFLRGQIGRMRSALRYTLNEFDTRKRKCVYTSWPGHEGRTGVKVVDGRKSIIPGEGIGGNYWDLLPFGGEDALATIYFYDALLDLAEIEDAIREHPQWCIAGGAEAFDSADLRRHAEELKAYGNQRFWNEQTGRFGTRDLDGALHDYGFTFLNNEAVYYGFATTPHARSIRSWISGKRVVEGDTSTGKDIYHWRFGPRSTTRRNVDYYFWGWSNPESIPWGYQVQDGGAVLGFSYHDLMTRLSVDGPDDVWARLQEMLAWFDETQAAGGYRAYYKDGSRGSMQGGNVAGGLGLDKEFFESILVPQVMMYGFLGMRPTADGFALNPRLPGSWPELAINRIHLHDHVLKITVGKGLVRLEGSKHSPEEMILDLPSPWTITNATPEKLNVRMRPLRSKEN